MKGVLIPQRVFIGDTAQFLFPLSEQEWHGMQTHIGVDTPISFADEIQGDTITIKDMRVILRDKQPYLQITFIPWETGTMYFPSFSFLNLQTQLPPVHIESILETTGTAVLQNPKLPLLIPGTDYLLYGTAIGIVAAGSILAAVGVAAVKKFRRYFLFGNAKRRVRLLRKEIKKLQKHAKKLQKSMVYTQNIQEQEETVSYTHSEIILAIKNWYAQFDYTVRLYMASLLESSSGATRIQVFSATYSELITAITALFPDNSGIARSFSLLYRQLEQERFGSTEQELFCRYAGSTALLLGSLPELIKRTEITIARLQYAAQKGAADA